MDFEQIKALVKNYQPSEATKKMISDHPPVLLAGVSGAGKNYLLSELLKTGNYHDFVTHTTRVPRENQGKLEQDAIDYYFINNAQAITMLQNQAFIEAKIVHDYLYGSSVAEYQKALALGKTPIADIDVQGVVEYKKIAPSTKALFILPPSYEVWLDRLKKRFASEDEFLTAWEKRRQSAIQELEFALSSHLFEWVINDNIAVSVVEANRLIKNGNIDFATAEQKQIAKDLLGRLQDL